MKDWRKDKFILYWGRGIISTLVMLGLWYPVGIVHEMGHAIICITHNGSLPWNFVFTNLVVICNPFPEEVKYLSFAMGGIFGMIASFVPIIIFRFLRKYKWVLNGFIGCGFMELGYAIFETTEHTQYVSNNPSANLPIALMAILAIAFFTVFGDKIAKYCSRKKSI